MKKATFRQLVLDFQQDEATFDNFLVDDSNRLAVEGGIRFYQNKGVGMNPFILTGHPGTGKSHLLHAIGNKFLSQTKGDSICILHTGDLVRAVGEASRYEDILSEVERFKKVSLLLVDDFQLAESDEGTQDQIFHILNEIFRGSGVVVVATRVSAHSLRGIHDHLGSRIRSGVEFYIKPASFELQVQLVKRFALNVNLTLPDNVIEFILNRFDRNPHELKRIVQQVNHYSLTSKRKVSISGVKSALEELNHG